jgi:hypothetical protein
VTTQPGTPRRHSPVRMLAQRPSCTPLRALCSYYAKTLAAAHSEVPPHVSGAIDKDLHRYLCTQRPQCARALLTATV